MSHQRFAQVSVVVVDNNADVRLAIRDYLLRGGARVEECLSIRDALKIIPSFLPNLIISAIDAEDRDGDGFLQDLLAFRLASHGLAQVIALADLGSQNLRLRLRKAGFSAILRKPFTPDHLLREIAAVGLAA